MMMMYCNIIFIICSPRSSRLTTHRGGEGRMMDLMMMRWQRREDDDAAARKNKNEGVGIIYIINTRRYK